MIYWKSTLSLLPSKPSVFPSTHNEGIIIIIILKNDILSVLGLDSGYTVKYSPPPLGVPSGFALGNSLWPTAIVYRISLVSSQYEYSTNHVGKCTEQLEHVERVESGSCNSVRPPFRIQHLHGLLKNL